MTAKTTRKVVTSVRGCADLGFLIDLEREAVIDAIPHDTEGIIKHTKTGQGTKATTTADDCDTEVIPLLLQCH